MVPDKWKGVDIKDKQNRKGDIKEKRKREGVDIEERHKTVTKTWVENAKASSGTLRATETHHKACFDSLESLLVCYIPNNLDLSDQHERGAQCSCLLQGFRPTHCWLLQPSELGFLHWQHAMQLRLQPKFFFNLWLGE